MSLLREDDPRFRPAMQLMEDAEYAEALRQLDAQLPQLSGEDRLVALYWKARTFESLEEWSQASSCIEQALSRVDVNSKLSICLKLESAVLRYVGKEPEKTVLEVRSLIDSYADELRTPELLSTYVRAKKDLGSALVNAGRYAEAIVELEEALGLEDRPFPRYSIYFWLGLAAHYSGELDKAKDYLEAALRESQFAPAAGIRPSYAADLRYNLALIAYKQRRFSDARRELEYTAAVPFRDEELSKVIGKLKAYLDLPETQKDGVSLLRHDDPRFRRAMDLMDEAKHAEALGQFDALLPRLIGEDRLAALYWKARTLACLREWNQASRCLDEALSQVDANSKLSICLKLESALLRHAENEPEKAALEIRWLTDHYGDKLKAPDLFWIYVKTKTELGEILLNAGRYPEAIVELEEALGFEDRPLHRYYIYFWLGLAAHRGGNLDRAKDYFEGALREAQNAPAEGISPSQAADLRYNLALIAYKQRRFSEARRELEYTAAVPFRDEELSRVIGKLKAYLDLPETQEDGVSLLRENDPRFRPSMQLMAQADYAEALPHLDALLPQLSGEDRLAALYWRARILKALGEWKRARTCLDEALQQAEPNSHLFISLKIVGASFLYIEQGPAEATAEIRSIFDHYSEELKSPDLYWTCVQAKSDLGHFLLEAGRYSEAIKELEDALSVETRPLTRYFIYFWIGLAAIGLGDLDKGKDYLERASHQAESAPAAGVSPYYTARLRYELARIAYRQLQFDDARRQIELAQSVPSIDSQLSAAIEKLKNSLDRPQVQ